MLCEFGFTFKGEMQNAKELRVEIANKIHNFVLELGAGSRLLAHTRALPSIAQTVVEMCPSLSLSLANI